VSVKYPTPETAGPGSAVILVVFQDTSPVEPKPDAVPEFDIVAPICSWTYFIYFYFTHNLPIEICTLLLPHQIHQYHH
jgi:hypothetical protein